MARIDNDGVAELNEKIKNPLVSIYNKLEAMGEFDTFADEFDFMYRFLDDVENNWNRVEDGTSKPTVVVNGQEYKPQGG